MRRALTLPLVTVGVVVAIAAPAAATLTPTITTFPASAPFSLESHPFSITSGSDGAIWFVSQAPSSVNRIDAAGNVLTKTLASATASTKQVKKLQVGAGP